MKESINHEYKWEALGQKISTVFCPDIIWGPLGSILMQIINYNNLKMMTRDLGKSYITGLLKRIGLF